MICFAVSLLGPLNQQNNLLKTQIQSCCFHLKMLQWALFAYQIKIKTLRPREVLMISSCIFFLPYHHTRYVPHTHTYAYTCKIPPSLFCLCSPLLLEYPHELILPGVLLSTSIIFTPQPFWISWSRYHLSYHYILSIFPSTVIIIFKKIFVCLSTPYLPH